MASKRLVFEKLSEDKTSNNLSLLGSLKFDLSDKLGSNAIIDLSKVKRFKQLSRDFIASLFAYVTPSKIVNGSSLPTYKQAILELLSYCERVNYKANARLIDFDSEFLLSFRAYLKIKYADKKSSFIRRRYGNILRLIEAGQQLKLAHSDLILPLNFAHVHDIDRIQPYSAGEALDIEAACRDHIRELMQRLDEGKSLLFAGKDPRGRANNRDPKTGRMLKGSQWNKLPNLLWYVINVLGGQYYKRQDLIANGHGSFINVTTGATKSNYRMPDVYGKLYPMAFDLIPFVILLAKKTGRNESSILSLKRDCLNEINGSHIMWYEKLRGSNRIYKKTIDNIGPFSPVAIIKTLQVITEPLSKLCLDEHKNYLFLGLTIHGHDRESIKPIDPTYIKYQMNCENGWVVQRKLFDNNNLKLQISLRSMRVYYLTEQYKKHGQLSKVSREAAHTLQNTTVSYLENNCMKSTHEEAIVRALETVKSIAKPSVITNEKHFNNSINEQQKLGKLLTGEQDVFFASCKDFFNKPNGPVNTPCDQPWSCFTCSNAVITRHVLPRVLAFKNFMQGQRGGLSEDDWNIKFSTIWNIIINDILPKFNLDVIEEAEKLASNQVMYIPLTFRV